MIDLYGRNIDYLRVSITDRCNLHCRYCLPPGLEAAEKDRERYLTKEEILRVCRAAETIGIHKSPGVSRWCGRRLWKLSGN